MAEVPRAPFLAVALVLVLLSSPAAPALAEPHADFFPTLPDLVLPSAPPACADDGVPAFRVLYVLPPSTLDWYEERLPLIRAGILAANGIVLESSLQHGIDVRLRFVCDGEGHVLIEKVRTKTGANVASFTTITRELREQGYTHADEKYWVLYEGIQLGCGGCVGQATGLVDDRLAADNANNVGGTFAITYVGNYGPIQAPLATFTHAMLHEASHTMGAVQPTALHASGGFHCNDGIDIMCYADGAAQSAYDPRVCPRLAITFVGPEMPYDCQSDDYFHADPPAGHPLSERWNLGSPLNRFIEWKRL